MLEDIRASGGLTNGMAEDLNKWPVARTFAQLARELAAVKENMVEKEEEVGELKSERSNTRVSYILHVAVTNNDGRAVGTFIVLGVRAVYV